jgi:hypothetical protein
MSGGISVEIELPVMKVRYSATVHQVKQASGLEYVIMKMVEAGQAVGSKDLDIGQMMGVVSMHSDLFPLVAEEIARLRKVGMLDYTVSKLEPATPIRRIRVTEMGSELLAKNISSSEKKKMERTLVYRPWRKERFSDDENIPFLDRPVRIPFGQDRKTEAMEYVEAHRIQFGIGPQATVKNPKVETSGAPSGYMGYGLEMYFDRSDGVFRLIGGNDLDLDYIRSAYSGDALLKKLPEDLFEMRLAPFEVKKWTESDPGEGCSLMLPCDLEAESGILFYGPNLSKVNVPYKAKLPDGFGCDAVVITSRTEGRMAWFIKAPAEVEGFEGKRPVKMVSSHKMGRAEIDRAVDSLLSGKRISHSEELKVIDETARALKDDTILTDRVTGSLAPGDVESLKRVLGNLGALEDWRWKDALGKEMEKVLCDWIDGGLSLQDASRFLDACSKKGIAVPSEKLMPRMFKRFGALTAADWGYTNGTSGFERRNDLAEEISAAALHGEGLHVSSPELRPVMTASRSISELMRITGITASEGYAYDPDAVAPEDVAALHKSASDLASSLAAIKERFPSVHGMKDFSEAERLSSIYSLISDSKRREGRIRRSADLAAESNGLLFFSEAERLVFSKLRLAYGDAPRDELLSRFKSSGLLPLSDYKTLEDMLEASRSLKAGGIGAPLPPEARRNFSGLMFDIVRLKMRASPEHRIEVAALRRLGDLLQLPVVLVRGLQDEAEGGPEGGGADVGVGVYQPVFEADEPVVGIQIEGAETELPVYVVQPPADVLELLGVCLEVQKADELDGDVGHLHESPYRKVVAFEDRPEDLVRAVVAVMDFVLVQELPDLVHDHVLVCNALLVVLLDSEHPEASSRRFQPRSDMPALEYSLYPNLKTRRACPTCRRTPSDPWKSRPPRHSGVCASPSPSTSRKSKPKNALPPSDSNEDGRLTRESDMQSEKAPPPTDSTPSGTAASLSDRHLKNAHSPMRTTPEGMSTDTREWQSENIPSSMATMP